MEPAPSLVQEKKNGAHMPGTGDRAVLRAAHAAGYGRWDNTALISVLSDK